MTCGSASSVGRCHLRGACNCLCPELGLEGLNTLRSPKSPHFANSFLKSESVFTGFLRLDCWVMAVYSVVSGALCIEGFESGAEVVPTMTGCCTSQSCSCSSNSMTSAHGLATLGGVGAQSFYLELKLELDHAKQSVSML